MDFVFDEEQQELRATARAFLAENSGSAQIRNAMESELGEGRVATGVFGAMMKVSLVNDGPVTITIDSRNRE